MNTPTNSPVVIPRPIYQPLPTVQCTYCSQFLSILDPIISVQGFNPYYVYAFHPPCMYRYYSELWDFDVENEMDTSACMLCRQRQVYHYCCGNLLIEGPNGSYTVRCQNGYCNQCFIVRNRPDYIYCTDPCCNRKI